MTFDEQIRNLPTEDDWDSYGGKAPTLHAINTALAIYYDIKVYPMSNGGLQLEAPGNYNGEIEIIISPNGAIRSIAAYAGYTDPPEKAIR